MIPEHAIKEMEQIVGPSFLIRDPAGLEPYGADATKLSHRPDAVVIPCSAQEISRLMLLANRVEFPVIPRGAGSGMSGGAVPVEGGLVISLERMNRILEIDPDNMVAKVEPGVITADLQQEVERFGLCYPPDPASIKISTIGGNVAECAGGLRAVKYGVTRDYVLGLQAVLPTGEILNTGVQTMKGVAGYDLTRLLVGSEGTLAIITQIILKLLPRPESKMTILAMFSHVEVAVKAVSYMIRSKVIPAVVELIDSRCIECLKDEIELSVPPHTGALLLIEVDGHRDAVKREASRVERVLKKWGALQIQIAKGEKEAQILWEGRRNLSPSLYKLRPHKISQDVVVPRSKMPALINFLGALEQEYGLPIPAFGHAGDGNIHVNVMLDKERPRELEKAKKIIELVFKRVIELGGTITGEHGIGMTKRKYLEMEIAPEAVNLMARIKRAFDPKGILNPGKVLPQRI